jgi:hypothetical protein
MTAFESKTIERKKPLLLTVGNFPYITRPFIDSVTDKMRVVVLNNSSKFTDPSILHVENRAIQTIVELEDKLDYAVFFMFSDVDKQLLESCLPKLEQDRTRTLILFQRQTLKNYFDVILATKKISSLQYAIVGDLFGNAVPSSTSLPARIVNQAVQEKLAEFTGDDLLPIFAISQTDTLGAIQYLLFNKHEKSRINLLYYEHPQTIISTIHLLKRVEPDLQFAYKRHDPDGPPIPDHKQVLQEIQLKTRFTPTYLDDILEGFEKGVSEMQGLPTSLLKQKRVKKRRSLPFKPLTLSAFLANAGLIAILLYSVLQVVFLVSGVALAKVALHDLENGAYTTAVARLNTSRTLFSYASPLTDSLLSLSRIKQLSAFEKTFQTFQTGLELTRLASSETASLTQLQKMLQIVPLQDLLATASYLYFSTQSSHLEKQFAPLSFFYNEPTSQLLSIAQLLPDVMGNRETKRYLILFQNNGELRPTGGFIGSVGELEFDSGKFKSFTIQDVYDLDGQLKKHVEPPFVIRRFLQPHLYLRDSNMALDFQEAASSAAALYFDESGKKVDGVIAVDYEVLRRLIEKVGGLYLPDSNITLTANNAFEYIQTSIDDNFFPGSRKKHDLLNEIFTQLTLKLHKAENIKKVGELIPEMLTQKHILISMQNQSLQKPFSLYNYGGEVTDTRTDTPNSINDYLYINEANIGANKANMTITRTANYTAFIQPTTTISELQIRYDNTDVDAKDYKLYLQLLIPVDSSLIKLTLNGKTQKIVPAVTESRIYEAKNFTPPAGVEVLQDTYHGKKLVGVLLTIPAHSQSSFAIQYEQKHTSLQKDLSYSLMAVKQPGVISYPLTASFHYPTGYIPKNTQKASFGKNVVTFTEDDFNKDTLYSLDLSR